LTMYTRACICVYVGLCPLVSVGIKSVSFTHDFINFNLLTYLLTCLLTYLLTYLLWR